jgi:hypothetical protein
VSSLSRDCAAVLAVATLVSAGCGGESSRDDRNASAADAAACLRDKGARVSGDPNRRPPGYDSPDRELVAAISGIGAFIAFYATEARAKELEPGVRRNAGRFKGVVVRDQNTTVVYTAKPSDDVRERVEDCLF